MAACPIYTTFESVKIRLSGKVTFDGPDVPENRKDRVMSDALLNQMIVDAETAVEQDLRGRYFIPFQSIKTLTWLGLPDHTKRAIRTIVDAKACILIITESFGTGTHITAEGYLKNLTDNYMLLLRRLLGQDLENAEYGEQRFRATPPLEDLKLAVTNSADTGFKGAPIDAGRRSGPGGVFGGVRANVDYAADQINDPSRGLFWPGGRYGRR